MFNGGCEMGAQAFLIGVIFLARIARITRMFLFGKITLARSVRDVGEQVMFFESIGIKGVYVSYWRLGVWFLFLVVQILFKQLTKDGSSRVKAERSKCLGGQADFTDYTDFLV